jgi:hypothetical protein
MRKYVPNPGNKERRRYPPQAAIREGGTYCRQPLGRRYLLQAAIRKEVPTAGSH